MPASRARLGPAWLLLPLLALQGCRTSREGWGRGSYRVLYESDALQIRTGKAYVEPDGREVLLRWVGARRLPGAPEIEELQLLVFDDRNEDGVPDPDEVLRSTTVRERTDKVLVPAVRVPLTGRVEDLKARLVVLTQGRGRTELWRLVEG
jgi:hypothetical protein